jgi:hypothetical protein
MTSLFLLDCSRLCLDRNVQRASKKLRYLQKHAWKKVMLLIDLVVKTLATALSLIYGLG